MKRVLLFLALFLVATAPRAAPDVSEAALFFHVLDWGQTREIGRRCAAEPPTAREMNPILGPCPGAARINRYFLTTGALLYLASKVLPEDYAAPLSYGWLGVEVWSVSHNFNAGIRINW